MSNDTRKHGRIALASLLGIVTQICSVAIALWSTPELVHCLGDELYTLAGIVGSFVAYFAYLELGIGSAYIRGLAIALGRRDEQRAQRLVETAHAIYCVVGTVGAVLIIAVGTPYLSHVIAAPHARAEVLGSLAVTALAFFASMALSASRALVIAAQRTDLYAWLLLVAQPAIPIAQVLAVRHGGQLVTITLIQAIGGNGVDLVLLFVARRLHPELRYRLRLHRSVWRELRGFSLYRFVAQLAQQGQSTGDRLMLGGLVAPALLAPYSIASSVAQRVRTLGAVICAPFFAAAAEEFGRRGGEGLARVTAAFGRRLAALLAVGCALSAFWARPFLTAWIGAAYATTGAAALGWLVVGNALLVLAIFYGQATDAAGVPRASALAGSAGLALSIATGIPLVRWLGPLGAAYGFCAGAALHLGIVAAAIPAIVGRRAAAATLTATLAAPAAVGLAAWLAMRLVPHGDGLAGALTPAGAGLAVAALTGFATGTVRGADVPLRVRRALGVAE
ncbi:MAG: oligosaccharide flippase family protein [Myxococcales bacterium]|nr:oligosaccharide flippase family protein [Myxococcales bacterium]